MNNKREILSILKFRVLFRLVDSFRAMNFALSSLLSYILNSEKALYAVHYCS
jgi:hypothetical protein